MKKIFYLVFLISLAFASCSSEEENFPEEVLKPLFLGGSVSEITASSALISWTAKIGDGTNLTYDVYLHGVKVADNISDNSWTFENLNELTNYSATVKAISNAGKTAEKTLDFTTIEHDIPSAVEVFVSEITTTTSVITWTKSSVDDGSEIVYDVYLNEELIQENLSSLTLTLEDLTAFKDYTVRIVAKSTRGKTSNAENSFKTLGTPPSGFPLTISNDDNYDDLDPHWLQIHWTPPTVEDGSAYHYDIYLDDVLIFDFLTGTADGWTLNNLEEGQTYTFKVVADAQNETETEESITFTTITHSEPTDYELEVGALSSNSATINWTASTDPDGGAVRYFLYLNGDQYPAPYTFLVNTGYTFDDLNPNTTYVVKVVAYIDHGHIKKELVKEVTFTTPAEPHPTLTVKKAVLYTPESQYFSSQLNVSFSDRLGNISIEKFASGDVTIGNFVVYTSSISSSKLSSSDYQIISSNKKGYVNIIDNGKAYTIEFDIVEETN